MRCLFVLLLFIPAVAHAGAWTIPEHQWSMITSANLYYSDAYFDLNGDRQSQQPYTKYELNPYIEYGVTDTLTTGANLFVQYVMQDQSFSFLSADRLTLTTTTYSSDNFGLADTELFVRQRLYHDGGLVLSVQPLLKLPSLFFKRDLPRGGNDAFGAELSLLGGYGFSLFDQHHYIDLRAGYQKRFNGLEDQYKFDAKLGISLSESIQLIPAVYFVASTDLPSAASFSESGENEFDSTKIELMGRYDIDPYMYFQGGIAGHIDGRNSGEGVSITVATGIIF